MTDHYRRNINYKLGLNEVRFMKNNDAYSKYYTDRTSLRHDMALGRDKTKQLLRTFLKDNAKSLVDSNIVVSYITNKGIHYIEPQVIRNELDIKNVMIDPVLKRGASDESNSVITGPNTVVYGCIIQWIKVPEVRVIKNTPEVRKRFTAPRLTEPSFDTGASL